MEVPWIKCRRPERFYRFTLTAASDGTDRDGEQK